MSPGGITPAVRAWLRAADPATGWLPWRDAHGGDVSEWTVRRASSLGLIASAVGAAPLPDARDWTCWFITAAGREAVAAPPAADELALGAGEWP